MTRKPNIELVYFEGCPNTVTARENIRAAVAEAFGEPVEWSEWDLMAAATPEDFKRYGSPTVLVDGHDVTGDGPGNVAMACRADGAPSVAAIAAGLSRGDPEVLRNPRELPRVSLSYATTCPDP